MKFGNVLAVLGFGLSFALGPILLAAAEPAIDYNRDIRPILAKNCFACHGPDEAHREAGLRLDVRDAATKELDSGAVALVPGDAGRSELFLRITSPDDGLRMPPADSGNALTPQQIALVKRWIEAESPYARHWSFVKPSRPSLPTVKNRAWPRNGIDRFVLAELDRHGLKPEAEADRHTLIRRLSLDLRGLPPIPAEVERFVNDESPTAYEQLVDRFLGDPAYGERWARMWLDLARYADSRGYGSDPLRPHIWRYRDWVIDAFNRNLPYDRFTIEQLAGDLLPADARKGSPADSERRRLERLVATAFHRNTMTNTEGGTDDEEFRVAAVKDRTDTTLLVWMGLTAGCAKCHTHKYDPITQREYYQLYAFFNQTADTDKGDEAPTMAAPSAAQRKATERIDAQVAELKRQLDTPTAELAAAQQTWEATLRVKSDAALAARFVRIELPGNDKMLSLAEVEVFSGEKNVATAGKATQSSTDYDGPPQLAVDGNTNGHYFEAKSTTHTKIEADPWWEVDLTAVRPVGKVTVWNRTDGGSHARLAGFRLLLLDAGRKTVASRDIAAAPNPKLEIAFDGLRSSVPGEVLALVDTPTDERTAEQSQTLVAYYRSIASLLQPVRAEIARLEKSRPAAPLVPVMQELPENQRRTTHVLQKGNFLDPGEEVTAAVPVAFHPFPADAPHNRLGLAQWLVDPENPLTARVAVNRFWARIFGTGLVETEEDFGTQGDLPSHPKLLDWLAVEFMSPTRDTPPTQADDLSSPADANASAWDMKRLLKLIVTSSTYRQSSRVTPEKLEKDPRNRLLSRAPRHRLEAEMVRDQALALSGLLSRKSHGPSVFPPQPDGLWQAAFNGQRTWSTSTGEDRYRRGLYTFWRRTIPYPSMAAFDAPSREICAVRRTRTNTPLQAFVTLNDPVYVEAAQALARRIVREGGTTPDDRVRFALQLCLVRPATPAQTRTLLTLYQSELAHYQNDPKAAEQLATQPLGPVPKGMNVSELAAWTVVANVLLNLDGVLTKN